jgi:hypothetical protein
MATSVSSTALMLGQTVLGLRLHDLRSVLAHLRSLRDYASSPMALWGESLAPVNPSDRSLEAPYAVEPFPELSEPMAGWLALLGGLFEEDVDAVCARGCLVSFASLLESPFLFVPHDAVVPGILTAGDVVDIAAALAPRPLCMEGLVDGLNRRVPRARALADLEGAERAYKRLGVGDHLVVKCGPTNDHEIAGWLLDRLLSS